MTGNAIDFYPNPNAGRNTYMVTDGDGFTDWLTNKREALKLYAELKADGYASVWETEWDSENGIYQETNCLRTTVTF